MLRHTGAGTRPVLDLAAAGNGTDAVPLGLVAGVMWSTAGTGRAQGRLEQVLGRRLDDQEARAWAQLAEGWVLRRLATDQSDARQVLEDAEALLGQMDAAALAGSSALLPGGLAERARVVAAALPAAVGSPGPQSLGAVETALKRLADHQLAPGSPTLETLDDGRAAGALAGRRAVRRLPTRWRRWRWQVAEGGWVDRARQVVANGVSDPVLGTAPGGGPRRRHRASRGDRRRGRSAGGARSLRRRAVRQPGAGGGRAPDAGGAARSRRRRCCCWCSTACRPPSPTRWSSPRSASAGWSTSGTAPAAATS